MSLIQGFIYKDFILVGGDGKVEFGNGIIDNYRKVFKLNEHTIIGFSGTISGNVCVFKKYINEDCSINHSNCSMSYKEIENDIVETFNANQDYLSHNEIMSFICGWDGEKMTGKSLFSVKNKRLKGVHDLTPAKDSIINVINCGLEEHFQYSFNQIKQLQDVQDVNIVKCKNIFKNTIDNGVKFDSTINKNLFFEKIRRVDCEKK